MKPPLPGTRRPPLGASFRWSGLFTDTTAPDSMWLRDRARLELPCALPHDTLVLEGELRGDGGAPAARGPVGLDVRVGGRRLGRFFPPEGPFTLRLTVPENQRRAPVVIELRLLGVGLSNTRAFLGRIFARTTLGSRWHDFRRQPRNRRLRLRRIATGDETLADFSRDAGAFDAAFITRHARAGLNLVGWFRAELGVGESVRCAARAAAAAAIPHVLVPLRLPCNAAQGDREFESQLRDDNPHPINLVHVDAPQAGDLDHFHGRAFSRGKYRIGYWAWELPEFPDAWVRHFAHVDEIWAPSRFTRDAIAAKSPVPVIAMPHAIDLAPPPVADPRAALGLPSDRFLFLFAFDLNSTAARKNPRATLAAFREAFGPAGRPGVGLVIKVHGLRGNEREHERLAADTRGLEGCTLIADTLPRARVTLLQQTCDCFVSLHRSEGFGLGVAESMFLGKPVIATDWSATAEFVTEANGCPVNHQLVTLTENHGPYARGQMWAEPDITHAAWHMRRLVEDAPLRERLGRAAAADIRRDFSPARVGALYRARLRALALW